MPEELKTALKKHGIGAVMMRNLGVIPIGITDNMRLFWFKDTLTKTGITIPAERLSRYYLINHTKEMRDAFK